MDQKFDDFYYTIAKESGGVQGLLDSLFSFLHRRTDFYYESDLSFTELYISLGDPGDKMGFPPGVS
jgi:hypothetical protein